MIGTKMTFVTLRTATLVLLAAVSTTPLLAQDGSAVIGVAANARVSVYNQSGSVRVIAWDRNEAAAYGSRSALRDLDISADAPGRLTLRSRSGAPIDLRVPRGVQLIVECGSGSVDVTGVTGTIEAESSSGTIQINATARSITATDISGGVTIIGGGSEVTHAESSSGSVVVTDAHGLVDAKSSSGSVSVNGTVRDAHLFSVSGDVVFKGSIESGGRLSAESSSANVELHLPANTPASYELSSVSGGIDNDFGPAATAARDGDGATLRFAVGRASTRVKAATVSGSVKLLDH